MNSKSTNTDKKKDDFTSSVYRVSTPKGEPALVIQSRNCCMLNTHGNLSRDAMRSVQGNIGEQEMRSLRQGPVLHYHMKVGKPVKVPLPKPVPKVPKPAVKPNTPKKNQVRLPKSKVPANVKATASKVQTKSVGKTDPKR